MIVVTDLHKTYSDPPTPVLHGLSFAIADGEFVSITGKSGSGKSTLLYCISTLDDPTEGRVEVDGLAISHLDEAAIHRFRNEKMGFVFQFHYLLPELTAVENVLMPARKTGREVQLLPRAMALLEQFGLAGKSDRVPKHLSGGEQQRVAIARALIMGPKYIFADEPTGNLDSTNADHVMKILQSVAHEQGTTVVYVTHDEEFAQRSDRRIRLVDGRLEG